MFFFSPCIAGGAESTFTRAESKVQRATGAAAQPRPPAVAKQRGQRQKQQGQHRGMRIHPLFSRGTTQGGRRDCGCNFALSHCLSVPQDSSRGSLEDQPGSDDSLCRMGRVSSENKTSCPPDAASQLDALYAEVDLTKKRQQRCASSGSAGYAPSPVPSSSNGGLGLSGPVNSMMQQRFPDSNNRLSLSGLTRTARDSRVDSGSVDMETPLSLSPKSPMVDQHLSGSHEEQSTSNSCPKKPIPPPRTRLPRKDSGDNSHIVNGGGGSGSATLSDHSAASSSGCHNGQCPSLSTLSGLSDAETFENGDGPTTALGELGQAIDQAIASMTAAASEHSDYDVPKPPRSLKVSRLFFLQFPKDFRFKFAPFR